MRPIGNTYGISSSDGFLFHTQKIHAISPKFNFPPRRTFPKIVERVAWRHSRYSDPALRYRISQGKQGGKKNGATGKQSHLRERRRSELALSLVEFEVDTSHRVRRRSGFLYTFPSENTRGLELQTPHWKGKRVRPVRIWLWKRQKCLYGLKSESATGKHMKHLE